MNSETKVAALPQREPVDPEVPEKPKRRMFTAAYKQGVQVGPPHLACKT